MAGAEAWSREETQTYLNKAYKTLDSMESDRFHEIYHKDVVHRSGLTETHGLEEFIGLFKQMTQMLPPIETIKHSGERVDVTSDGLIYSTGRTTVIFRDDAKSPVVYPVMGVYKRVPRGQPEEGKIYDMVIYEDHLPLMQKAQEIAAKKG